MAKPKGAFAVDFVKGKPKKTRQGNGLNSKSSHGRKNGRKYRGQGKG
jgi:hypothetical protein